MGIFLDAASMRISFRLKFYWVMIMVRQCPA